MTIIPDPILVVLQLIPFLITIFVLKSMIFDPMIDYLEEREQATAGGREEVDAIQDKIEARLAEYQARLNEARQAAADIRAARRKEALAAHAAKVGEARKEAESRIGAALKDIESSKTAARKQLEDTTRALATQITTQVLGRTA